MATFYNQATLSWGGIRTSSNIASGEITEIVSATKTAISVDYGSGDGVAYAISIVNTGTTPMTEVQIEDDLGAFAFGTGTLTPLDYTIGSVKYFQNGVLLPAPTVNAGPPLVISGITVPEGGSVLITYEARANSFAPLEIGSLITNTATVSGIGICDNIVTSTIPVREETALSISKAVCPGTVNCGGQISYTFIIQNNGNAPAVATDNVSVSDLFDPILTISSVTYNGEEWTEGTGYTYDPVAGAFATANGQITVPAASYVRDPVTGALTVNPGVAVITVTGTV